MLRRPSSQVRETVLRQPQLLCLGPRVLKMQLQVGVTQCDQAYVVKRQRDKGFAPFYKSAGSIAGLGTGALKGWAASAVY